MHEIKYDGYRMLCRIADGEVQMVSRNGKDWTAAFPSVAHALARLPVETAWVDAHRLEAVHRVAAERVDPDRLSVVVVGDRASIEKGIEELDLPIVHLDYEGQQID